VIEVPEEAQGSLLTVPGKGFAWLAASVVRAHFGPNERRRLRTARAWVRLRELARKAASLRFDCIGSALWLQALDSRRRREAGDAPAIMVRLTHPEVMGNEWGVDIAVFQSETASSVKACALGMLACGVLIPGARARRWTSARVRREAIAGHKMIKLTVGGQDVVLDHSRTLAQSGIGAGATLALKSTGLLGGMPTSYPATNSPASAASRDEQGQIAEVQRDAEVQRNGNLETEIPRTLTEILSGIGAGATLALKSTGLLGSMPTAYPHDAAAGALQHDHACPAAADAAAPGTDAGCGARPGAGAASGSAAGAGAGAQDQQMPHELMLTLRGLDDAALRREFDHHADKAAGAEGEKLMSKAGLASFMRDKGLAHGEAEVGGAMERVDTNKSGDIDFGEFCTLAQATSDLEKVLQAKHLECILCYYFPKGKDTNLEDLADMHRAQFSDILDKSKDAMVQVLVDLAMQMKAVGKAQDGAGGSKFRGELKGGKLDDFHRGVTGVCGEPDADIEKGMCEEHTERPDSHVEFSTSNYGLTTTPSKEWALVLEGGSGCAEVEGKEGSVIVKGTRGCCKVSGLKWLNTGNADPTWALGSKWQAVGDTQPTEGRQLTNSMLADALASKTTNTARLTKVFHELDRNRDGALSLEEFTPLVKAMGVEEEAVQPIFSDIDTGSNGGISKSEFLAYFRQNCGGDDLDILSDDEMQHFLDELFKKFKMTKVVDFTFTKEDLDKFGIIDLRSTDFIEASGSYFKPIASSAEILANPRLANALMHQTEFTQQEWDAFGVHGLRMHHFVKSGNSYFQPAGEVQADVRVLRPLKHYGDFGADGRLKWGVGDVVVVGEALTAVEADGWGNVSEVSHSEVSPPVLLRQKSNSVLLRCSREIAKDTEGTVLEFNAEVAKIAFRIIPQKDSEPVLAELWVLPDQFYRLYPRPSASDTPIQRRVKLARLRRCDVLALILYTGVFVYLCGCVPRDRMQSLSLLTAPCPFPSGLSNDACSGESRSCSRTNHAHQSSGPMFVLYNALLRHFGSCGVVEAGIDFGSNEFWDQFNAKQIDAWVEHSGHRFTNTIHALASAIKKLQGLTAEKPSTRLYRGLGGLDVTKFAKSCGFTDKAFTSTTKDRKIALEYSGVHKGLIGTVLCIETSTTNNGAVISEFSQAKILKSKLRSGMIESMYQGVDFSECQCMYVNNMYIKVYLK